MSARPGGGLTARVVLTVLLAWLVLYPILILVGDAVGGGGSGLTAFAKVLPLTHALALMRYAMVDRRATGLQDIWGMHNTTVMASLMYGPLPRMLATMSACSCS